MNPKTIIHLLSGGLDSVTMLYDLKAQGHNVHCLLFDYRQSHLKELDWAKYHSQKCNVLHTLIEIPDLGGMNCNSWIVPNRNAIFISLAVNLACKANADTVTIGCNAEDAEYFPDCRGAFISSVNESLKLSKINVEVCAPYLGLRKWQIGGLAREMGVSLNEIWTCYTGKETPCGECPACQKLKLAMP